MSAVLYLRNGLAHYKAEWSNCGSKHSGLEQEIARLSKGFPGRCDSALNKFPIGWMTAANVNWSVDTAAAFVQWFANATNHPDPLTEFRAGRVSTT